MNLSRKHLSQGTHSFSLVHDWSQCCMMSADITINMQQQSGVVMMVTGLNVLINPSEIYTGRLLLVATVSMQQLNILKNI